MTATPYESRGFLGILGAVLAGCIAATLLSTGLKHPDGLLFMLVGLTALPLFIGGLGVGMYGGLLAGVAGFMSLLTTGPSNFAVIYALVFAAPVALLSALAMRYKTGEDKQVYWYPEGKLMVWSILYPCVIFLVLTGLAFSHPGGLLALTKEYMDAGADAVRDQMDVQTISFFNSMVGFFLKFMPGLMGISWMFLTMISMIVAQYTLEQHKWSLRPAFSLANLYLPGWLVAVVIVTGAAGIFGSPPLDYTGSNLAIMLGMPFFFVGFAIVHAWAATKKFKILILVVFYGVISVLPFFALLLMPLGIADQWAHFRQRLTGQPKAT